MAPAAECSYRGRELELFARAHQWKKYVKAHVAKYLTGDVLEVGAGVGGTTLALHDGRACSWVCLEPDLVQATQLRATLAKTSKHSTPVVIAGSLRALLERPRFDCVLYLDVLEHIYDDRLQICQAANLVRPGGRIVVLAPAHQWLFSEFDKQIGHFRRYDKRSLQCLMPPGWSEIELKYLDSLGVLLSLANAFVLRQHLPSRSQLVLWDRLCVPISRIVDCVLFGHFGKSLLAVWENIGTR